MQKIILTKPSLKPFVPEWVTAWAIPEFEDIGPPQLGSEYLHSYNPTGVSRKGADFFEHLKATGTIRRCLSFEDGRHLIKAGMLPLWFVRRHPCLWRSTAYDISGNLFVPWVQNILGQIPVIYWWWLEYDLYPSHQTILFDATNADVIQ